MYELNASLLGENPTLGDVKCFASMPLEQKVHGVTRPNTTAIHTGDVGRERSSSTTLSFAFSVPAIEIMMVHVTIESIPNVW